MNRLGALVALGLSLTVTFGSIPAHAQVVQLEALRYSLTIDGYEIAAFSELEAIRWEIEIQNYWEMNADGSFVARDKPAKMKPPSVTLRRGLSGSLELWNWHEAVRTGSMSAARKSAALTIYAKDGKPVGKYWLERAWPSSMTLEGLKVGRSEALFESVTIVCETIVKVDP